ncbi:MAG: hypothetical protein WKF68_14955 [Daejeonella sp.]
MEVKREFYWIAATVFLLACQSEPSRTVESVPEVVKTKDQTKTLVVPWNVGVNDSTDMMEIRKDPASDMTNLGPKDIIDALNLKHPQIKLSWVQQTGTKAFIKIDDASYLTQRSGTQGAQAYLAEVTYSLTELKGISAVDFSFEEGDHAVPGTYTRDDFVNFN